MPDRICKEMQKWVTKGLETGLTSSDDGMAKVLRMKGFAWWGNIVVVAELIQNSTESFYLLI